jgi:ABC-2 type transport system permease protein
LPPEVVQKLAPGVTWGNWVVPIGLSLGIVVVMALTMLAVAIAEFSKTE